MLYPTLLHNLCNMATKKALYSKQPSITSFFINAKRGLPQSGFHSDNLKENKKPKLEENNKQPNEESLSIKDSYTPEQLLQLKTSLSPEQKERMESRRKEAEEKLKLKLFQGNEIGESWKNALRSEFEKAYFKNLQQFIVAQRKANVIYPPENEVFSWTKYFDIHETKVVILGQDPYHGHGQAHGLCFSVKPGVPPPPSLVNMYKELSTDIPGFKAPDHGFLLGWAKQGVLLLNAVLTVQKGVANSHKDKGWEKFTDATIHWINENLKGIVFLLWGSYAQKKGSFINKSSHLVLNGMHPSPLSAHRGFFGCQHFSKANQYLKEKGKQEIDWTYLPLK